MEEEQSAADADMVQEILLRLPVKTLKRFQCVSKSFYSLISSPQFQKDHFRRSQLNPLLLTLQTKEKRSSILHFSAYNSTNDIPIKVFIREVSHSYFEPFMQSCLGLVCISSRSQGGLPILICNPSTEEIISLPLTREPYLCTGFGYAASTDEFKVVRFFYGESKASCEVFTLGTGRWRKAKSPPFNVWWGVAPFLHEALHFLPLIRIDGVNDTDCIATFDIDTEEYTKAIRLPNYYHSLGNCLGDGISSMTNFMRLTKLDGSLCLTFDFGKLKKRLELYILKDYENAVWVKGYSIDVSAVYPHSPFCFWVYPVDNIGDEDILLNCSDEKGGKLLRYDRQEGIVSLKKDKVWAATLYVENFYPLRSGYREDDFVERKHLWRL